MKKYHLYLWLIALMGLFAACSQDETADALQTANESNRVTLTASLPADFAQPGTRANEVPAFPTGYKLRCILEVWDEQLTTLKVRKEVCPAAGAAKIDFTFELDNGAYNALLWADYISESTGASSAAIAGLSGVEHYDDGYYKTDNAAGLKEVQVLTTSADYKKLDAFCAAKPFSKEAAALKDLTATLTRPLAKLTIAEKNTTNFGYCRDVLAIYNAPQKLDVSTGTVSGVIQMSLSYNSASPGFGDNINVNGTPCKVLFSSYILAGADGTMPEINLTFTATTESGKVLPDVTIPAGIPVKRNHRINAAGTLIAAQDAPSKAVNMSVDINSGWAEPEENKDIASTVWDGTYPTSEAQAKEWMGKESAEAGNTDGSKRVFTITAARQLAALHYLVANYVDMANATSYAGYSNATYKLAADIDLNNYPWVPIGTENASAIYYPGVFDGQGHTIRGMNITGDYGYSGFFASVKGVVKHLNVKGTVASTRTSGNVSSGGIAGKTEDDAYIAFCSFEGTIASASASTVNAGGIAGELASGMGGEGNILSCYTVVTAMDLTGSGGTHNKGGIAGKVNNYSVIKGCYWKTLTGVNSHYGSGTLSDTQGIGGSFPNAAGANATAVIDAMNTATPTGYDYKWQAGTNGSYPVLVKKP